MCAGDLPAFTALLTQSGAACASKEFPRRRKHFALWDKTYALKGTGVGEKGNGSPWTKLLGYVSIGGWEISY